MPKHCTRIVAASGLALLTATASITPALAHAFLDHAVPGVGATVSASPGEVQLSFTQSVVVALSSVSIAKAGGGAIGAAKPVGDGGSSSATLHVRLAKALPPGAYVVTWRVVSVDTHPTSGSYRFTVGS